MPAIADSGCTGHYVALRDRKVLRDVRPCTQHDTITVRMPNGTHIKSSHIGRLNLPGIPKDALLAYLFAEQHASPLLSLGVLADHGMKILLSRNAIVVIAEITGEIVLEGTRNAATRLWEVNLPTSIQVEPLQQHSSANIIHNENDQQLMAFYHAVLFSPTMSTMQAAADAGLLDFLPGFTAEKLRKNKIHTMATAKGHLDANRRGQRSTHRTESRKQRDRRITKETADSMPTRIEASTEQLYVHMSALHTYTEHLDATSKFMLQSRAKNWYLLIIFNEDANYIHFELLKSRSAEEYRKAIDRAHRFFAERGCTPAYTWLDNETSDLLGTHFAQWGIQPNYVPRANHSANRAERCIRTAKNHFIAGLSTVAPDFPPEAWDELVPQCEYTLNLMRLSRITPNISAFQQLCGAWDWNAHPMAPPGTKVAIHVAATERESYGAHAVAGHYVGPALEHYRSYRVWTTSTQAIRISNSLDWFPQDVKMPGASTAEQLTAAMRDLQQILTTYTARDGTAAATRQPSVPETTRATLVRICDAFEQPPNREEHPAAPPGLPAPTHSYQRSQLGPTTRSQSRSDRTTEGGGTTAVTHSGGATTDEGGDDALTRASRETTEGGDYQKTQKHSGDPFSTFASDKKRLARRRRA